MANLNARLNDIDGVMFIHGSCEAAERRPYRLIVSNPPSTPAAALALPWVHSAGGAEGWETPLAILESAMPFMDDTTRLRMLLTVFSFERRQAGHQQPLHDLARRHCLDIQLRELFRFFPTRGPYHAWCARQGVVRAHYVILEIRRATRPRLGFVPQPWVQRQVSNLQCILARAALRWNAHG